MAQAVAGQVRGLQQMASRRVSLEGMPGPWIHLERRLSSLEGLVIKSKVV